MFWVLARRTATLTLVSEVFGSEVFWTVKKFPACHFRGLSAFCQLIELRRRWGARVKERARENLR